MTMNLIAVEHTAKNGKRYVNFYLVNEKEGLNIPIRLAFWSRKLEYLLYKKCEFLQSEVVENVNK